MRPAVSGAATHFYIWQRILSPHMSPLAEGLRDAGVRVTFVYCTDYLAHREALGWAKPDLPGIAVLFSNTHAGIRNIAQSAPDDSIHFCEGIRNNLLVGEAQRVLQQRGLRQLVIIETINCKGWKGALRKAVYRALFLLKGRHLAGVLAIGARMPGWVAQRGFRQERIFPFTYFLHARQPAPTVVRDAPCFRVLFVGQLIRRKRLDLLLQAAVSLSGPVEVEIVGSGPEEAVLRAQARGAPKHVRVRFMGRRDMSEMPGLMSAADCLVLPSDHDGWGAVVSEALMVGTPAICSDACGSAEAVRASGVGGVFRRGDAEDLARLLTETQKRAPQSDGERSRLAAWGQSLSGDAGARYLLDIVAHLDGRTTHPAPPWRASVPNAGNTLSG